jgi:transposase InsO family protein
MVHAQAGLAACFARLGCQPPIVQTDRGACFLGAEGGAQTAVPSRLTLWLWGLGSEHRLNPPRTPQRNGAVERFHGAVEHSWAGEADGMAALQAVWNLDRPPLDEGHQPYRGRAGFAMQAVWRKLGQVRVTRRVNRQGKLSLWDRSVGIGREHANQKVTVTFAAERRRVLVHDAHEVLLAEREVPWLTCDWLWAAVPRTDQAPHAPVTSTTR